MYANENRRYHTQTNLLHIQIQYKKRELQTIGATNYLAVGILVASLETLGT